MKYDKTKKAKFIEAFSNTLGSVSKSAKIAGITRPTFYNWLAKDFDFNQSIREIEESFIDIAETAIRNAIEGSLTETKRTQTVKKDAKGRVVETVEKIEVRKMPPNATLALAYLEKQAAHRGWGKEGLGEEPPEIVFSDENEDDGDSTD